MRTALSKSNDAEQVKIGEREMKQFYAQNIYISKTDIKIICIRETTYGPYVLDEPCKTVPLHEKNHLSKHVNDFMETLKKLPKIEDRTSDVWENISGEKNFRKFSKKHLCIVVKLIDDIYKVGNLCRLPDGSYGMDGDRWKEYIQEYVCSSTDLESLDKNIVKAIEDGEAYLKAIGSHL